MIINDSIKIIEAEHLNILSQELHLTSNIIIQLGIFNDFVRKYSRGIVEEDSFIERVENDN